MGIGLSWDERRLALARNLSDRAGDAQAALGAAWGLWKWPSDGFHAVRALTEETLHSIANARRPFSFTARFIEASGGAALAPAGKERRH